MGGMGVRAGVVQDQGGSSIGQAEPLLLQTNLTALTPSPYLLSFPMLPISTE